MKITPEQYEAAYRIGLELHDHPERLGISEAKRRLQPAGLNENSAADFVYDVGHLLRGECYKRALSEEATDDYLTWIRRDRGDAALTNALQALEEHIAYRKRRKATDNCKGLVRLLKKHRSMAAIQKEAAFVLEWRDAESAGVMDWFPLSWFAEERETKHLSHPVGAEGRPQGKAFCDVIVRGDAAELDYRPYPEQNDPHEVLSGVVRLTFTDEDRTKVVSVAWMGVDEAEFAQTDFRLHAATVPAILTAYHPPAMPAERVERSVRQRPGQARFRRDLKLCYENRCCISGCTVTEVLEGAHIDPYQNLASDHVQNGLLMRADLHTLFDKHLIAINPDTKEVHVAKRVRSAVGYDSWHGLPIQVPTEPTHRPDQAALRRHWEHKHE
jgi:hypothetical protein